MSEMRQARVFDDVCENGRPYVSRPLVPVEETPEVLAYLENAPIGNSRNRPGEPASGRRSTA
jgi:hypothetical protein